MGLTFISLCFILTTASGFGPMQRPCHHNTAFPPAIASGWSPLAAGSELSEKNSATIKQMSWFLTTQLLETALKEVSKGEGESKMSLEDLAKLSSVLQGTELEKSVEEEEGAHQREPEEDQDLLDTTGVGGKEELGTIRNGEEKDRQAPMSTDLATKPIKTNVEAEMTRPLTKEVDDEYDIGGNSVSEQSTSASPSEGNESQSSTTVEIESRGEAVETQPVESLEAQATPPGPDKLSRNDTKKEEPLSGVARIPDVISTSFGRSLEVVSAAVPPLREPLVQQPEERIATPTQTPIESSSSGDNEAKTPAEVSPTEPAHITKSSDFRRDDLATPFPSAKETEQVPQHAKSTTEDNEELAANYGNVELEDRPFESLKDLGMLQNYNDSQDDSTSSEPMNIPLESGTSETPSVTEGTTTSSVDQERVDGGYVEASDSPPRINGIEEERLEISNATVPSTKGKRLFRPIRSMIDKTCHRFAGDEERLDSNDRVLVDTILQARKQPKSPEEEANLAEKYGRMTVEDRAYTILCDLGMI
eukprot:scaffold8353_cov138-Cylindrotheca_fusiformis.AAC.39